VCLLPGLFLPQRLGKPGVLKLVYVSVRNMKCGILYQRLIVYSPHRLAPIFELQPADYDWIETSFQRLIVYLLVIIVSEPVSGV